MINHKNEKGLTIQANMYYKMLISWTSQRIKETYTTHNAFDFKNVRNFDRSMMDAPGPCVLFATPGMISGGFSLEAFKKWAPSEMNLVTLPGYCVAGTIGHKLMSGKPTKIELDKDSHIDVRCQIHQLSFSPHTDAKGIMDLVKFLSPKHVVLVHGEKPKMATLKGKIHSELGIPCYDPANNERVSIPSTHYIKADASNHFLRSCLNPNFKFSKHEFLNESDVITKDKKFLPRLELSDERVGEGILVTEESKEVKMLHQNELLHLLGEKRHEVEFAHCFPVSSCNLSDRKGWIQILSAKLSNELSEGNVQDYEDGVQIESFRMSICSKNKCVYRSENKNEDKSREMYCCCRWSVGDERLALKIMGVIDKFQLESVDHQ